MFVKSSFEDLLLVSLSPISLSNVNFHICNPLTRQFLPLPAAPFRPGAPFSTGLVCERVVAFNPFDEAKKWRFIPPPVDLYYKSRLQIRYSTQILCLGVYRDRLRAYFVPMHGGPTIWESIDNDDVTAVSWCLVHDSLRGVARGVRYHGLGLRCLLVQRQSCFSI
ncbi:hypothetical protein TorRG33x02_120570 [Trema orientale]|uniref:Uncharacterized protein n=1 Tax=Trema orientale TaxID=63057 RepID=A0A2P5F386_TREOI|nr:hypothetical protein TorRG33x02_120570 [Trema orientale]